MFSFLVLTAKTSLQKLIGRLFKSVLVLSTVTLWMKLVFWWFVFFLWGSFSVNFRPFCKTKWARLSNKSFLCPHDFFEKKSVFSKNSKYFYRSCTLNKIFWAFWWEKAETLVETAFYVSWKTMFSKTWLKTEKATNY